MCLLVPVDARPCRRRTAKAISLQSFFRKQDDCQAGNLLQIHIDGGKTQAKCDGTSTKSLTTSKSQEKLHHLAKIVFLVLNCVSLLRTIFASLACTIERVHVHNVKKKFPQAKLGSEINVRFPLNKHRRHNCRLFRFFGGSPSVSLNLSASRLEHRQISR